MDADRAKRALLDRFRQGGGGARTTNTTFLGGRVSADGVATETIELDYEGEPGEAHTERWTNARTCDCHRVVNESNAFVGYCHASDGDGVQSHGVCKSCVRYCLVCNALSCARHCYTIDSEKSVCCFWHLLVYLWRAFWRIGL